MPEPLRFHKSFYVRSGLEEAAEAYSGLAQFAIEEEEDEIVVTLTANDASHAEALADHFGNHALFASLACQMDGP